MKASPGTKLPTVQILSKSLGVSIATLDASLRKLEAKGIIERRHGSGIYVAHGALQRTIGLVVGHNLFTPTGSQFYQLLVEQCEKQAAHRRQNFSFFLDTPPGHSKSAAFRDDLAEAFRAHRLDGVLIAARHSPTREQWIRSQGVPAATFSVYPGEDTVSPDFAAFARLAVRELAMRGCRRPALIGVLAEHGEFFREAMAAEGLPVRPEWVLVPSPEDTYPGSANLHDAAGRAQAERLLATPAPPEGSPDSLVITDDVMTRGVCSAFLEAGVLPGRDVTIATHANRGSGILHAWASDLIRIEFDPAEIVERLFAVLEERIAGAAPRPPIAIPPHVVSPALIAS